MAKVNPNLTEKLHRFLISSVGTFFKNSKWKPKISRKGVLRQQPRKSFCISWQLMRVKIDGFQDSASGSPTHLILVTRPLAVLGQTLEALVDESHIGFVDVQPKQTQATGGTAANAVEKLQCFMHQVVICLTVVLLANVVLEKLCTLVKLLFLSCTNGKETTH